MGKRKEDPVRPLFPTFHEYEAARKAHLNAATMLHNAVRTVIQSGTTPELAMRGIEMLKKYDEAYQLATYGEN